MNAAAAPAFVSSFRPILANDDNKNDSSLMEEPLFSPLAIFRDGENGATGTQLLMRRANPIDSMDTTDTTTSSTCCPLDDSHHSSSMMMIHEEDVIWTDSHQRVISPFPDGHQMDDLPNTDSWKETTVDFSHFFPRTSGMPEECECHDDDDFSLSSASAHDVDDLLVLADDLNNQDAESFWESASQLDLEVAQDHARSSSPAQVSIGSNNSTTTPLFLPPSPTSAVAHVHEWDLAKPPSRGSLMPSV